MFHDNIEESEMLAQNRVKQQDISGEWIIPVNSVIEEYHAVKTMYCKICKSKGHLAIKSRASIVEQDYQFDVAILHCYECGIDFSVKFFNPEAKHNRRKREYIEYVKTLRQYGLY